MMLSKRRHIWLRQQQIDTINCFYKENVFGKQPRYPDDPVWVSNITGMGLGKKQQKHAVHKNRSFNKPSTAFTEIENLVSSNTFLNLSWTAVSPLVTQASFAFPGKQVRHLLDFGCSAFFKNFLVSTTRGNRCVYLFTSGWNFAADIDNCNKSSFSDKFCWKSQSTTWFFVSKNDPTASFSF